MFTSINDQKLSSLISKDDLKKINALNADLIESLQFEINNRLKTPTAGACMTNQDKSASDLLDKINVLLHELNALGMMHADVIQFYKSHKYKVKLPPLLSEIYEIENGSQQQNHTASAASMIITTSNDNNNNPNRQSVENHSIYNHPSTAGMYGGFVKKEANTNGSGYVRYEHTAIDVL